MSEKVQGEIVSLRPATIADRKSIFAWLTNSDLTHKMLGPPKFPDCPIPTWNEFLDGYPEHFFNVGTRDRLALHSITPRS